MQRMLKIWGTFVLSVVLLGASILPQPATAEELPPPPKEGTASDNPYFGEGRIERPKDGFVINVIGNLEGGHSYVAWLRDNLVRIGGDTFAAVKANTVGIKLYLQRWNPSKQVWEDVVFGGDFKKNNTDFIAAAATIQVLKGYYYRTRAIHYVTVNGKTDQAQSITTYIYVP